MTQQELWNKGYTAGQLGAKPDFKLIRFLVYRKGYEAGIETKKVSKVT